MQNFYSNGKLLLTGEYVVLDGASALAIPTKLGQSLRIESIFENKILWKSLDEKGNIWFEDVFSYDEIVTDFINSDTTISNQLLQILKAAKQINPKFLDTKNGFKVTTKLDFPKNWGLGSSSTLINNIAKWANVNAYELLEKTFGGSGYDIACAQYNSAITYQLSAKNSVINEVKFNPSFKNHLYFVYLNKKQNSREGIAQYKTNRANLTDEISKINTITSQMVDCKNLEEFQILIKQHESIISKIIKQQPIKEQLFNDFKGSIKSLGAWGGDFILVASKAPITPYFKSKGFEVVIPFEDMVL
ncbi:MAG: GYDIA family GHMP kinase [Gelidibacter sp.]